MTADDVLAVLDLLAAGGITVWVDGGWAVDVLLGEQTRPTRTSTSASSPTIPSRRWPCSRPMASPSGATNGRPPSPCATPTDSEVDLHPVRPTADGGGDQVLPDGGLWHYDPPGTGTIGGRPIICLSLETQVRAHLGFDPRPEHVADMARLRDRFGIDLPAPYDRPG